MADCSPCTTINPCYNCGCQESCNCPTPIYTNEGCPNGTIGSNCVVLKNETNTCLGIVKNTTTLTTLVNNLLTYLKNIFVNLTSQSLLITPSGSTCNSSATIEVVPSTDLGNSFVLGSDHRPFVPKINMGAGYCITFSKTLVNGVITFTPIIDLACLASLLCPLCSGIPPTPTCPNPQSLAVS